MMTRESNRLPLSGSSIPYGHNKWFDIFENKVLNAEPQYISSVTVRQSSVPTTIMQVKIWNT